MYLVKFVLNRLFTITQLRCR